jgi:crotonobetainyl-CoA:carnitine CoA-transferase CaiB-like acyl-CoA transferase
MMTSASLSLAADIEPFVATATGRPLVGVRVIDLIAGPLGAIAKQFAELGADVIRIEPPDGGPDRFSGYLVNGVSLDFIATSLGKRAATTDQLAELAVDADILIAPRGLDVAPLRAKNVALVVVSVSDFGDTDGYRNWSGTGAVYYALSGELSRSGIPGREPLLPPEELALACAAVQAAYVTLVAYYNALKTGVGDHLDFSALDGASHALDPGYGVAGSATAGAPAYKLPRGRAEARHQYPIFECKDGFVRLCILAPRQWQGMFEWMGRPEEFADPSFAQLKTRFTSKTLIPAIARFLADKSRRAVEEASQRFGVPAAAVLDLDEMLASEQITARRAFVSVEIVAGVDAPFPDGILEIDGDRMGISGSAPALPVAPVSWRDRGKILHPPEVGDRPLSGLRVLDFGVIVVGAESGRLLADQGADVIKIETSAFPDGSRQSAAVGLVSPSFAAGHRNKKSLGLNVRDPEGRALLLRLVADADVLLSNFKGGTLESLGLDYASLKAVNPRLIVTDSSAFGSSGPWAKRMGYGPLVRAASGLTMQWQYPGEPGSFSDAITVYPDHAAARVGAIGVLALLIRRLRTGKGGSVTMSQAEVMLSHLAPRIAAETLTRAGQAVAVDSARSAVFRCAGDDEWCVVTIRNSADQDTVTRVTGGAPIAEWLLQRSPRDAMTALQDAGVPAGAMLRVVELPEFDYYVKRRFFREVVHPHMDQPFMVEGAPVRSGRLPDPAQAAAPVMGEHSVEIARHELGLSDAEIARLTEMNILEGIVS